MSDVMLQMKAQGDIHDAAEAQGDIHDAADEGTR